MSAPIVQESPQLEGLYVFFSIKSDLRQKQLKKEEAVLIMKCIIKMNSW